MSSVLCVIPARYASQRFPGKPLVQIGSRPMIQCVYEAARDSGLFQDVIVASDDARIAECVRGFGGKIQMTSEAHPSGTHRVAEVAAQHPEFEVVANVQGDQPPHGSHPGGADRAAPAGLFGDMTTVASPLSEADRTDPNSVKVVCGSDMRALYFTRANVPYFRSAGEVPVFKHLGLYAFRRERLLRFVGLPETPLERCESLEQLRALEHGYTIGVTLVPESPPEINSPADLEAAAAWVENSTRYAERA